MSDSMTSSKPYIVRAFYDWISDNQLTPYIVVDVNVYGVLVPMSYVNDGQIVLNIASSAIGSIALGADVCSSARAMMLALGCIQALECNQNTCPAGVATQNKELMKETKHSLGSVEKAKLLVEAEEIFMEEMPIIPLCSRSKIYGKNPKLHGEHLSYLQFVDFKSAYFEDFQKSSL